MTQVSPASSGRIFGPITASTLLWLSRTLLGLLAAYPVLSAVVATGIANGPERDAVLFQPGSLLLLEGLRVGMPWLASALSSALLASACCAVLELLPLAFAIDLLRAPERSLSGRALYSLRCFPPFFGLGALALAVQGVLLLGASLLQAGLKAALRGADERLLSGAPVALFALALLAGLWVNGVLDVARAAVVERDLGARAALAHALTVLRRDLAAVLCGSYAAGAAALFAYLAAAWLMTRIDVRGPSPMPVVLCFVAHQVAVLFAIAWRVRWLTRALELNQATRGSAGD